MIQQLSFGLGKDCMMNKHPFSNFLGFAAMLAAGLLIISCGRQPGLKEAPVAPGVSEEQSLPEIPVISREEWDKLSPEEQSARQAMTAHIKAAKSNRSLVRSMLKAYQEGRIQDIPGESACEIGKSGPLTDKRVIPALIEVLKKHPLGGVRAEAAASLAATGDTRAMPALLEALQDRDVQVQVKAAGGLIHLGEATAVFPVLARIAQKEDIENWVVDVEEHLQFLPEEEKEEERRLLIQRFQEITLPVQAIRLIRDLDDSKHAKVFSALLNDRVVDVRFEAAAALLKYGENKGAVVVLRKILDDTSLSEFDRAPALIVLAKYKKLTREELEGYASASNRYLARKAKELINE